MYNILPTVLIGIIWCASFLIAVTPSILFKPDEIGLVYLCYAAGPVLFVTSFITIAGLLSRIPQKGIVAGKFPREAFHKVYFLRRIYGTCWTQVFYFKPLYSIALSIPILKKYLFRLFGYKHGTNFTVYPDTWVRDLPILKIGNGAYLSNRATIGTNICLSNGSILVDGITVGDKGLVGHLAVLAPGANIGNKVEIGVVTAIAIRVQLADGSKVDPCCAINHGVAIGPKTRVGASSFIGLKSVLGPNLNIPPGSNIPAGSVLNTQSDVDKYYHSETKKIEQHVDNLRDIFRESITNELKA